ncbi:MAG: hypothetical protein SFX73_39740 [Kofleriaceae bacterium]|nr:hypothetical protein [Kofleriaceae bacterium]
MRRTITSLWLLFPALLVAACGSDDTSTGEQHVVAGTVRGPVFGSRCDSQPRHLVRCLDGMRVLALLFMLGCSRPAPSAPAKVAPAPVDAAPQEDAEVVIEHDPERIESRRREIFERAERQRQQEEIRAKIRDGRIVCTPTELKLHGPSAICTEKAR